MSSTKIYKYTKYTNTQVYRYRHSCSPLTISRRSRRTPSRRLWRLDSRLLLSLSLPLHTQPRPCQWPSLASQLLLTCRLDGNADHDPRPLRRGCSASQTLQYGAQVLPSAALWRMAATSVTSAPLHLPFRRGHNCTRPKALGPYRRGRVCIHPVAPSRTATVPCLHGVHGTLYLRQGTPINAVTLYLLPIPRSS